METDFSMKKEDWYCPGMTSLSLQSHSCFAEVGHGIPMQHKVFLERDSIWKSWKLALESAQHVCTGSTFGIDGSKFTHVQ